MNSALNIFIIEDDPKACENLKIAILQAPQFNLLGITNNAYDAYNFILTQKSSCSYFGHRTSFRWW